MYREASLGTYQRVSTTVAEEKQTAREGKEATKHNTLVKGKKRQNKMSCRQLLQVVLNSPPVPPFMALILHASSRESGSPSGVISSRPLSSIFQHCSMYDMWVTMGESKHVEKIYLSKTLFRLLSQAFSLRGNYSDRHLMVWLQWKQAAACFSFASSQ